MPACAVGDTCAETVTPENPKPGCGADSAHPMTNGRLTETGSLSIGLSAVVLCAAGALGANNWNSAPDKTTVRLVRVVACIQRGLLAVQHREIRLPRPHPRPILLRHHAADLRHVSQIVYDPCRQQLPQRDRPKLGMLAHQVELARAELHGPELDKVRFAQHLEASKQLRHRETLTYLEVARSVERFEASILPLSHDDPSTHDPIGLLGMDEVTDHVEGAPGIGPFVGRGPLRREARKHGMQHTRGACEDQDGFLKIEVQRGHPYGEMTWPVSVPSTLRT